MKNLKSIHSSKIMDYLYPIYAKQWLFSSNYEEMAQEIQKDFILTPEQWDAVLQNWEEKERILSH